MPYKRRPTPEEVATAKDAVRSLWVRALDETRAAANMSAHLLPAQVEAHARDVCLRALSCLSIEARERVLRALVERYVPAAANSSHKATVRSHSTGSNRE